MVKLFPILAVLCMISNLAWAFGSRDPILETQSKAVPVTEETLKDEPKPGAPAPTFKLVHDTGVFFVKAPVEQLEEASLKKWEWVKDESEDKEGSQEEYDISYY